MAAQSPGSGASGQAPNGSRNGQIRHEFAVLPTARGQLAPVFEQAEEAGYCTIFALKRPYSCSEIFPAVFSRSSFSISSAGL